MGRSTGAHTTDVASQDDQNASSDDDCNAPDKSPDTRPARPTKQDTLVGN